MIRYQEWEKGVQKTETGSQRYYTDDNKEWSEIEDFRSDENEQSACDGTGICESYQEFFAVWTT